ncbi:MAG: D-alanyl-D-alanine carboxypeptidase/D-alanyl-D-alanine-endopeptidase [Pseudomonadota bacterium]
MFQYLTFFYASVVCAQTHDFRAFGVPAHEIHAVILDEKSGALIEKHQENKPALPASVMKIVTSVAALELLQKNHSWSTDFWYDAQAGALTIVGNGDPKITWEDLQAIFFRLRELGVRDLPGGIILDATAVTPVPDTAFDGQDLKPYNVAPHGLLFNFKSLGFKFRASAESGNRVSIEPRPWPKQVAVVNQLRLTSGPCGDWKERLNAQFLNHKQSAQVVFRGTYAAACGEREWFVSLLDHEHYNQGFVEWVWRQSDMGNLGPVRTGTLPVNGGQLKKVATHQSPPLSRMLADVNQFSNNVMARLVLMRLAQLAPRAQQAQRQAVLPLSEALGAEVLRHWWQTRAFGQAGFEVENGSGLSRRERLTALGLANVLLHASKGDYAEDFRRSLVKIDFGDGLDNKRYGKNMSAQHAGVSAFVKTGTLNDVRSLAGYVRRGDAPGLVFVIMVNSEKAHAAEQVVDAYLRHVVQRLGR